jgi:TonB family protein
MAKNRQNQIGYPKQITHHVRIMCLTIMVLLGTLLSMSTRSASQTSDEVESDRRPITRIEPEYPETLKRLYIGGVVRVATTVAPNGTVENAELLGGNPVLGQSAMKAIKQWKYSPTNTKEKLIVKLTFDPHR